MDAQWPPRSPHEALLSTPRGRERLRRLAERSTPSPTTSPTKLRSARLGDALQLGRALDDEPDDDEDDEETLQLKLEAIQAQLKLKKLQAAKARQKAAAGGAETGKHEPPEPSRVPVGVPLQAQIVAARERMDRPASQSRVQIPASPVKRAQNPSNVQTSPLRVQLGIDKGLRAADISLKRAPNLRKPDDGRDSQQSGYLRRAQTPLLGQELTAQAAPPLSFNERLAAARTEEAERKEKALRVQNARSTAFSVKKEEMEEYKSKATELPDAPYQPPQYSRDDILGGTGSSKGGSLHRSNTAPSIRSRYQAGAERAASASSEASTGLNTPSGKPPAKGKISKADMSESSVSAFEPYSGLHLSKRILPHQVLTRSLSDKKNYLIKDLLKHVKAPDWSLPDVESDIVVFAIIASKSEPRSHRPAPGKEGKPPEDRGKYMVITLVDLTYEIELYLFNSGFERFWKLTRGTVVAILNPVIMPPPKGREATGRFGLVINSDADTILEIGNARDLGFCKSVKKDGHLCNSWVNARRTEHCEFHTNEAVRLARSDRMELNTTSFGDGPRRKFNSRTVGSRPKEENHNEQSRSGYDWATSSRYYVSGGAGHGAGLLDDDEREGGMADRAERSEALKRRLTAQEKEREIAQTLGRVGGGAGRDYLARSSAVPSRLGSSISSSSSAITAASNILSSQNSSVTTISGELPRQVDAQSLGLVRPRGQRVDVDLGRIKRKRPESSQSNSTAGGSIGAKLPLGWGTSLKDKLTRMKDGEKLDGGKVSLPAPENGSFSNAFARGARSPVRKKTRFVTEKGIREAGRESLGDPLSAAANIRRQVVLDDDDDDELVIV